MPIRERILTMGVTGSGKSYQWLQMAEYLLSTGAKFRCIDTDNDIQYMLETQFPSLLLKNGGNVVVHPASCWPEYREAIAWLKAENEKGEVKDKDWVVVDKISNAWMHVQDYYVQEVFHQDVGEYFLAARKSLLARGDRDSKGKKVSSLQGEVFEGWKDWIVINKLYRDFITPIIYQLPCHVYMATNVEKVEASERDASILSLFGGFGLKPVGQKEIGGQLHTILLLKPGKDKWYVSTAKDRAGRAYFVNNQLSSLFVQYLVARAGWEMP